MTEVAERAVMIRGRGLQDAPVATVPPSLGSVLAGRYRLESLIGSGGSSAVYRALDLVVSQRVAVKVMRATGRDPAQVERHHEEARLLGSLAHPGVLGLYDSGTAGPHRYLVTPLICGPTLGAVIGRGPVPAPEVRRIGLHLASALAYLHGRRVLHRDVKPGNVLLDASGHVVLVDFGIARDPLSPELTRDGCLVGTAGYFAPERIRGQAASPGSDCYSFGLTLLEALTGQRVYTGTPLEQAIAAVDRPPAVPRELGSGWCALLALLTAPRPEARPTLREAQLLLAEIGGWRSDSARGVGGRPGRVSRPAAGSVEACRAPVAPHGRHRRSRPRSEPSRF
jgi:eukaryotic-like serine/threonine-protein kinase